MKEPKTPEEWRHVTALAEACLLLEAARQYGLVTGGPRVDVDRCVDVLNRGKAFGYVPTRQQVDDAIAALVAEDGTRAPETAARASRDDPTRARP